MTDRPTNGHPGDPSMDHAAAHERIEDLLLDPAHLATLESSSAPEDVALREHLAGCAACAGDLESWRRLQVAVQGALPGGTDPQAQAQAVEPLELPPSLRARVLAGVSDTDRREASRPGAPISIARARRGYRLGPWVGLAAGIMVLTAAGVIAVDQVGQRAAAQADAEELAEAIAVVDRMLATDHKVVELRNTSGAPAGTISWSRHDWVVLTKALDAPAADGQYLCWLETDGRNVAIGRMEFAGPTAYWVASIDEWQTWEIGPTTRFVVTLEAAGAQQRTGPAILEARLSS
jgi:hypothetical protein